MDRPPRPHWKTNSNHRFKSRTGITAFRKECRVQVKRSLTDQRNLKLRTEIEDDYWSKDVLTRCLDEIWSESHRTSGLGLGFSIPVGSGIEVPKEYGQSMDGKTDNGPRLGGRKKLKYLNWFLIYSITYFEEPFMIRNRNDQLKKTVKNCRRNWESLSQKSRHLTLIIIMDGGPYPHSQPTQFLDITLLITGEVFFYMGGGLEVLDTYNWIYRFQHYFNF